MKHTATVVCVIAGFVLYVGMSCAYAAHPSAEKNVSDDRGSQGNQELIKGESIPKKGEDEKVDDAKVKADTQRAREEFEKRNTKGRENSGDKKKDAH
ncbi:MAG TPA: hypothetical protein VIW47_03565 [Nitrospiraceae bacterium]|jgi:hypothetical protein